jgi:DNA-binding NtrC family response regulator
MLRHPPASHKPTRHPASEPRDDHQGLRELSRTHREKSLSPVVLVIERDSLLRWALYEVLTDAGFRVLTAPGSPCAEAWLHEIEQDLSLALVDDEAWPLAPRLRAALHDRWPALPVVAMLHSHDPAIGARTRDQGATEVLVKPFDLPDLVRMIERLTGYSHERALANASSSSLVS